MNDRVLYEVEILPCGNVEVSWKTIEGEFGNKVMTPEELPDGVKDLVKTFIDKP
jgi:hypothetical protein